MSKFKKLNSILLIDDDKHSNFINEINIKKAGIAVFVKSFPGAEEALSFLKNACVSTEAYPQPGIIFLDLNMPGMNGWQFMEQYKTLPERMRSEIKVVILTSSVDKADNTRAEKDSNVSRFMSKPLLKNSLLAVINDFFETH